MADFKYLKLGAKASSFYDMATGLKISGDEIVKVHPKYLLSKRTSRAIQGGHLVYANEGDYAETGAKGSTKGSTMDVESLRDKFISLWKANKSPKDIADSFNKTELTAMAEMAEIEVEDNDTKMTLVEALIEATEAE